MNSLHFFVELLRIRELFAKYFCFEWKIGNDPMKEETLLWIESYLTVLPPTIPIKKTHGPFFAYLSNYFYLGKNRMVIKFGSCSFWRMRKKKWWINWIQWNANAFRWNAGFWTSVMPLRFHSKITQTSMIDIIDKHKNTRENKWIKDKREENEITCVKCDSHCRILWSLT